MNKTRSDELEDLLYEVHTFTKVSMVDDKEVYTMPAFIHQRLKAFCQRVGREGRQT